MSFPLVLNVNPFLDKDQIQNEQFLVDLIEDNPLNKVRSQMEVPKPYGRTVVKKGGKTDPKKTSTSFSTAASTVHGGADFSQDAGSEQVLNENQIKF